MRVAAIYDIHANLPALDAVLAEIGEAEVDVIIVGGDVLPGPMPRETLDRLLEVTPPVRFLYGNGEIACLEVLAGKPPAAVPEAYRPAIEWNARQLSAIQQSAVGEWPKTVSLEIPRLGEVLFCHATPRDENECFTRLTEESLLLPVFEPVSAALVVCGHTHMQFDRRVGGTRVVNAGSVGMPFGHTGGEWLLLGPDVEFRRTAYDLTRAAEQIRQTKYPGADDFAERYVMHTPAEEAMLAAFTNAHLR